MTRHTLTETERAERRRADRERLEQAARALLTSEGWQRWMRVRSTNGLARYSFGNQLLIALQCPDATYVAGFRAFLKLNRGVRRGERAIRILAPMSVRGREAQQRESDTVTDEASRRIFFRAVPVFDVSQTEVLPGTEPIPLEPPCEPIAGSSHAQRLPSRNAGIARLPLEVIDYRARRGAKVLRRRRVKDAEQPAWRRACWRDRKARSDGCKPVLRLFDPTNG